MPPFFPDPSYSNLDSCTGKSCGEGQVSSSRSESANRILRALNGICQGSDNFHLLREATGGMLALDIPILMHEADRLLRSPQRPIPPLTLAAIMEVIEETREISPGNDEVEAMSRLVLECAEELGDQAILVKASLQHARICSELDPPQLEAMRENLHAGLSLSAEAFGPLSAARGYSLLEDYCVLGELQQQAMQIDAANQTADTLQEILRMNPNVIDRQIIWAARVVADILAMSARYQDAADVLDDLVQRADGHLEPDDRFDFGVALRDYGDILLSLPGRAADTEAVLRRAAAILDVGDERNDPHGVYINVMVSLADALSAQGKYAEAMELKRRFGNL